MAGDVFTLNHKGVKILVQNIGDAEQIDIKASVKAIKKIIDKISSLGFSKYLKSLKKIHLASYKQYVKLAKRSGMSNAMAYYSPTERSIFAPLDEKDRIKELGPNFDDFGHEFGHHVYMEKDIDIKKQFSKWKSENRKFPSELSKKNHFEFFAEMFNHITGLSKRRKVDKDIFDYMKKAIYEK